MNLIEQIEKNHLNFCPYNKIVATLVYLNNVDKKVIEAELKKLIASGELVRTGESKNKYATSKAAGYVKGKVSMAKGGYAFLSPADGSPDLFIPAKCLNGAMNNDIVIAKKSYEKVQQKQSGECEVIQVLERGTNFVVGSVVDVLEGFAFVKVNNKKVRDVLIQKRYLMGARKGDKVVVQILKHDNLKPEGVITEIIRTNNPVHDDVLSIIREFELYEEFPEHVIKSAKQVPQEVDINEIERRTDLRDLNTFTIDGEDAKDLDDAISISVNDDGTFRLGVHIADVGHYVPRESVLDGEAFKRGTSTYFPNAVFPMLPRELSNGICSLNEGVDRLTLSIFMNIDKNGKVVSYEVCEGVIISKARMTYTDVQKILDGDEKLSQKYHFLVKDLKLMEKLALILEGVRTRRGSLNFELPEPKIILNDKMEIIKFEKRPNTMADRIIESFMLEANETIAKMFVDLKLPFVYRVHEKPSVDKLRMFTHFTSSLGIDIGVDAADLDGRNIQNFINSLKTSKYYDVVNKVILRSMQKAKYSPVCSGHFGLGAKYYCHFTSPIRRYPDLTIHRIIKDVLNNRLNSKTIGLLRDFVADSADQSSYREIVSEKAEREVDDYFRALYLKDKIGQKFSGIISGVTENGIYVELENTCEGFIPVECLPDDTYNFVETKYKLVGPSTQFQLGDKVKIVVESVSPFERRVDFSLFGCNKKRVKFRDNKHKECIE